MCERDTPYGNYNEFEPVQLDFDDWKATLSDQEIIEWITEDDEAPEEEYIDKFIKDYLQDTDALDELLTEKFQEYLSDCF